MVSRQFISLRLIVSYRIWLSGFFLFRVEKTERIILIIDKKMTLLSEKKKSAINVRSIVWITLQEMLNFLSMFGNIFS